LPEFLHYGSYSPLINGLIIIVAVVIVGYGAHIMVDAASRIARRLGISELIIGLTIVALGTSAPEFAVTLMAAFRDQGDISVGNIVGSNIFNLGFILGGTALVRAIPVTQRMLKRDGAVLIASTVVLFLLVGLDRRLDPIDGAILFLGLVVYLGFLFRQRFHDAEEQSAEDAAADAESHMVRDVVRLVLGMIGIVTGSHVMVGAATAVALHFGISEWVIGVTIVAAGTSAPEFATSLAGVLQGRYAISAGNLIGSDIFNLLGVLGLAGLIRPMAIHPGAEWSLLALVAMVVVAVVFMRTGWKLSRLEGGLLVLFGLVRWIFDFAG